MKTILFITGTRADYGKLKSLIKATLDLDRFIVRLFVTGMHMLSTFGSTYKEIEKDKYKHIYKYINQTHSTEPENILSSTILGLSNYLNEYNVDLIIVHGDRIEALAGAITGAFKNIRVLHIEGGEVSGTIDESKRQAITKFSHIHMVSNFESKNRVLKMGENEESVFIIGSPDIDIMLSKNLPSMDEVKKRYEITFKEYAIAIFHPVTTEYNQIEFQIKEFIKAILDSQLNYVLIYPNNDLGSKNILKEYKKLNSPRLKIMPSMRFEYFLTTLKNCSMIIGNSSTGIREADVYGKVAINIGTRQNGRYLDANHIINSDYSSHSILKSIHKAANIITNKKINFGDGNSSTKFIEILSDEKIFKLSLQKKFIELD